MGHKVNPVCLRLGINQGWVSRWFTPSKRDFVVYLQEDRKIREFLKGELAAAAVARIIIERSAERLRVIIHTARPGILIGRRGENISRLQEAVQQLVGPEKQLKIDYIEINNPYIEAPLIAESIAFQLEKRIAFRRAMKRAIQQSMEAGLKGVKIVCDGRLAGSEMTRRESYRDGKVPLGTLRSQIDFGQATAHTTAGCIGVKVWTYKGDVIPTRTAGSPDAKSPARIEEPIAPQPS